MRGSCCVAAIAYAQERPPTTPAGETTQKALRARVRARAYGAARPARCVAPAALAPEEAAHRCRDTKKMLFGNTLAHVDNTFRHPLNVLLLYALAPLRRTSISLPGRVVGRVAIDGRVSQAASQKGRDGGRGGCARPRAAAAARGAALPRRSGQRRMEEHRR